MKKALMDWFLNSGSGAIVLPSSQSSGITFSDVGEGWMTADVTPGDGSKRVFVYRIGTPVDDFPEDGIEYSVGEEIGIDNFVAASGAVTEASLEGLDQSTTIHWRVFEYNGSGTGTLYNLDAATGNPNSQATTATAPVEIQLFISNMATTNQPNSQTIWNGGTTVANVYCTVDLGDAFEVKLQAVVGIGSASANTPRVYPGIETDAPLTTRLMGSGSGGESCSITSIATVETSLIDIAALTPRIGRLILLANGGDAAADPGLTSCKFTIYGMTEKVLPIKQEPNTQVVADTPDAETLIPSTFIGPFDTTHWKRIRLQVRISSGGESTSANNPRIIPAYSLNGTTSAGKIGTGLTTNACLIGTNGQKLTSYITFPVAARGAAVWLCLLSAGGDDDKNFTFRNTWINYRFDE